MAELRVRNVDRKIVEMIKKTSKNNGLTMEKQLLAWITEKLTFDKKAFFHELRKMHEEQRQKYGVLPDSTPGIRAERDAM